MSLPFLFKWCDCFLGLSRAGTCCDLLKLCVSELSEGLVMVFIEIGPWLGISVFFIILSSASGIHLQRISYLISSFINAQAKICKLRIVVCQRSIWRVSVSVLIISVLLALGLNLLIIYLLTLYPSLVPIFLTVKNHLPVSRILWNKFGSHRYIFRMIMCSVKEWVHFLLQAGFWGKVLCSSCSLKLVM